MIFTRSLRDLKHTHLTHATRSYMYTVIKNKNKGKRRRGLRPCCMGVSPLCLSQHSCRKEEGQARPSTHTNTHTHTQRTHARTHIHTELALLSRGVLLLEQIVGNRLEQTRPSLNMTAGSGSTTCGWRKPRQFARPVSSLRRQAAQGS